MVENFKMFEYYISKQEQILNQLLDKINLSGKDSLSKKELSFLDNYPNEELSIEEKDEDHELSIKNKTNFKDDLFEFQLSDIDIDDISNDIIISGDFIYNNISLYGYFIINQETTQIFPYFYDDNKNTIYDIVNGYEEKVYDFLENIYLDLTKNNN